MVIQEIEQPSLTLIKSDRLHILIRLSSNVQFYYNVEIYYTIVLVLVTACSIFLNQKPRRRPFKMTDLFMEFCMHQHCSNKTLMPEWQHFKGTDMSADTKIAELLTELHQLIKQTQVSWWHWLIVITTDYGSKCLPFFWMYSTMLMLLQVNQIQIISSVSRRRGHAVNIICSTFKKHMRGCRQKTRVSFHIANSFSTPPLWFFTQRFFLLLLSPSASPYYRTKLRGLYTTAKADAEAECRCVVTSF